jgi:capsular polysaccharide biosynthesis protein
MNAEALAKMETEQRGERLTVVDPPVVPDQPASPNRPMLIGGGIAGGLAVGAAIAFLLELLLGPIRGVSALQRVIGAPPLVVIPVFSQNEGQRPGWLSRLNWFKRRAPNAI